MITKHEVPLIRGTTEERQLQVERYLKRLCEELNVKDMEWENRFGRVTETLDDRVQSKFEMTSSKILLEVSKVAKDLNATKETISSIKVKADGIDLSAYAKTTDLDELKEEVESKISIAVGEIDLSVYAKTTDLKEELANITITKDMIEESVFDSFATEDYVSEKVSEIVITEDMIKSAVSEEYATKDFVTTEVGQITINKESILQEIESTYATQDSVTQIEGSMALEIVKDNDGIPLYSRLRAEVGQIRFNASELIIYSGDDYKSFEDSVKKYISDDCVTWNDAKTNFFDPLDDLTTRCDQIEEGQMDYVKESVSSFFSDDKVIGMFMGSEAYDEMEQTIRTEIEAGLFFVREDDKTITLKGATDKICLAADRIKIGTDLADDKEGESFVLWDGAITFRKRATNEYDTSTVDSAYVSVANSAIKTGFKVSDGTVDRFFDISEGRLEFNYYVNSEAYTSLCMTAGEDVVPYLPQLNPERVPIIVIRERSYDAEGAPNYDNHALYYDKTLGILTEADSPLHNGKTGYIPVSVTNATGSVVARRLLCFKNGILTDIATSEPTDLEPFVQIY